MTIKDIGNPVSQHLNDFNKFFKSMMISDVPLLNLVIQYITMKKGKQVRPVLVFLSAEISGGVNKRTYTGAALVELLHTATLVHDDVVDEASIRRGMASINANWNNKIAVLIGDFLLAKGLLTAIDNEEFNFLKATSHAVRRMSEGELLQIQKSKESDLNEETYFKIISNKTASLLAACCEIGAISSTNDIEVQQKMKQFGEFIGTAFQIRDDVFDYQRKNLLIGKPVGNDLKEKKMTLPLIYALNKAPKKMAKEYMSLVKGKKIIKKDIEKVINFVIESGGLSYAESVAKEYGAKAKELLNDFPDSAAKKSLTDFCSFVIDRDK